MGETPQLYKKRSINTEKWGICEIIISPIEKCMWMEAK
jgi:hypothetical protein